MSAEGNQNASNTAANAAPAEDAGAVELAEKYAKKDKVVVLTGDDQETFIAFVESLGEGNYLDWTAGVDTNVYTGLAMVKSEAGVNRLIAIASEEAAFADPVVRKALYKMYVNRVANAAGDNDATAAQFLTVAGNFKQKFDLDAFKFQAKILVKFLRSKGLSGITNNGLRQAFASAAFATSQFPRMTAEMWDSIIGIAETNAAKNGFDTSIFDHWKATRAVATSDLTEISLDLAEITKDLDALNVEDAPEEKAPAAAQ